MTGKILVGDFLEKFKEIPDESIDCVITSPPYWGLRDYGTGKWEGGDPDCKHDKIEHKTREKRGGFEGSIQSNNVGSFGSERQWTSDICPDCGAERIDKQMGLELDFNDYLDKLDAMMKECRRVLKPTGTVWVNLGDTYSTVSGGMKDLAEGGDKQYGKVNYTDKGKDKVYGIDQTDMYSNLQSKSRVGIPERFYIRCIDAGWVARNHIPWIKANCMPSSVQDRFTNKWESVFFFAKERKYYFNLDAVREEPLSGYGAKVAKKKRGGIRKGLANMQQNNLRTYALHEKREKGIPVNNCHPKGKNPGDVFEQVDGKDTQFIHAGQVRLTENGTVPHYDANSQGKNPGDVFHINTRPCKEAHFATFPPELPEKILKCSCPQDGTVLDPFFGAGTVGLVAEKLNMNWVGIELNPEYAEIAKKRIGNQQKLI